MKMNNQDSAKFDVELTAVLSMLGKGEPTSAVKRVWWSCLAPYPLKVVLSALEAHVRKSKFGPTPADIIEIINIQDGRITADEAWSIALISMDETETVVWTDEIARAREVAMPIFDAGDKIGARMAFRGSYEKLVTNARNSCVPVRWYASLGHDAEKRTAVLENAVQLNRIAHSQIKHYLPAPEISGDGVFIAGLLTGKVVDIKPSEKNKKHINRMRSIIEVAKNNEAAKEKGKIIQRQINRLDFEQVRQQQLDALQVKQNEG